MHFPLNFMNKTALSASNIYIENSALKQFNNLASSVPCVGGELNAVKNREKRHGRHVISGMDFTREKLQVSP
jgi:hypothetical protein